MGTMQDAIGRYWKAWGPWAVVVAIVVLIALIVAISRASALLRARPAWWQPVSIDQMDTVLTPTEFENRLVSQIHQVRGPGEEVWDLTVKSDLASSWLTTRLPKWVAGQVRQELGDGASEDDLVIEWPEELREIRVSFEDPFIFAGAKVVKDGREQYLSAVLEPQIRGDGSLWMIADRVQVGRVGLPAGWVLSEAEGRADEFLPEPLRELPEAETFFDIFSGERPFSINPEIRLGDGRRVRLLMLQAISDGRLHMRFETITPGARASAGPEGGTP